MDRVVRKKVYELEPSSTPREVYVPLSHRIYDVEDTFSVLDDAIGRLEAGQSRTYIISKLMNMCYLSRRDAKVMVELAERLRGTWIS